MWWSLSFLPSFFDRGEPSLPKTITYRILLILLLFITIDRSLVRSEVCSQRVGWVLYHNSLPSKDIRRFLAEREKKVNDEEHLLLWAQLQSSTEQELDIREGVLILESSLVSQLCLVCRLHPFTLIYTYAYLYLWTYYKCCASYSAGQLYLVEVDVDGQSVSWGKALFLSK